MKILILALLLMLPLTANGSEITRKFQPNELKNKLFYLKGGNIWYQDPSEETGHQLTTEGGISVFSISQDNSLILLSKKQKLYFLNPTQGSLKPLTTATLDVTTPSISPEKDKIAYINKSKKEFQITPYLKRPRRHIWLLDLKSKKSRDITSEENTEFSDVQWSPDGKYLSFHSHRDNSWRYYIVKAGEPVSKAKEISEGQRLIWLNDKSVMVNVDDKHTVNVTFKWIDVENGAVYKIYKGKPPYACRQFAFLPPNSIVCEDSTETPDFDITILNIDTGIKKLIATDARSPVITK